MGGNELFTHDFVSELHVVWLVRINSESYRQFDLHSLPKDFELIGVGFEVRFELKLVVSLEEVILVHFLMPSPVLSLGCLGLFGLRLELLLASSLSHLLISII